MYEHPSARAAALMKDRPDRLLPPSALLCRHEELARRENRLREVRASKLVDAAHQLARNDDLERAIVDIADDLPGAERKPPCAWHTADASSSVHAGEALSLNYREQSPIVASAPVSRDLHFLDHCRDSICFGSEKDLAYRPDAQIFTAL